MDRAFEAVKLAPPPRHHTLAVVGLSLPQAMAVLLPDAEAAFHMHMADQYKLMFQAMRGQGVVDEPLFEVVAGLIERLDADSWVLGVATGKSDGGLNLCLACLGLSARSVTSQPPERHPNWGEGRGGKKVSGA